MLVMTNKNFLTGIHFLQSAMFCLILEKHCSSFVEVVIDNLAAVWGTLSPYFSLFWPLFLLQKSCILLFYINLGLESTIHRVQTLSNKQIQDPNNLALCLQELLCRKVYCKRKHLRDSLYREIFSEFCNVTFLSQEFQDRCGEYVEGHQEETKNK